MTALFEAYLDESGTHDESPLTAFGGVIAHIEAWSHIMTEWSEILSEYGVSELHATDLSNLEGEFSGWNESKRRSLINRVLTVFETHEIALVGTAVQCDKFYLIREKDFPDVTIDAYDLCFMACVQEIITIANRDKRLISINLTLEKRGKWNTPPIKSLGQELCFGTAKTHYKLNDVNFKTKNECPPLQLADFVVYELFKSHRESTTEGMRPRYPLEKLIQLSSERASFLGRLSEEGIRHYLDKSRELWI